MSRFGASLFRVVASAQQLGPAVSTSACSNALGCLDQHTGWHMLEGWATGAAHQCNHPSKIRGFAAAAGDQQGGKSQGSEAGPGPGSERLAAARAPTRLQDLVQGATERIAQNQRDQLGELPDVIAAEQQRAAFESRFSSTDADVTVEGGTEEGESAKDSQGLAGKLKGESWAAGGGSGGAAAGPAAAGARLLHPKFGYAALGGVVPDGGEVAAGPAAVLRAVTAAQPRLHPKRLFMPGQTYEPQDLNPFARSPVDSRLRNVVIPRPSVAEVIEKADYKNVAFLSRWFLSPAGRLLPRRQTRLPVTVHKHVSRQIKLARHMGLMAGETRLDRLHLPELREREAAAEQARRDAAAAAAMGMGGPTGMAEAEAEVVVGEAARAGMSGRGSGVKPRYNELLDFGV